MEKGILLMHSIHFERVYKKEHIKELKKYIDLDEKPVDSKDIYKYKDLKNVSYIFGTWGMPLIDKALLDKMPNLKAIFYAAGTVKGFVSDDMWNRNIIVTSAYAANAVPVAEYTFAQIILRLKSMWFNQKWYKKEKSLINREPVAGSYKSKVGIISLGMIGKNVVERLKSLDVDIYTYDPYIENDYIENMNLNQTSLEEIFKICDVISLHTPWLKETENLVSGKLISSMKRNATLINTSRGAIINQDEMIKVLEKRKDIYALLDVTYPEPPDENSKLYNMENVVLTPHIAGSSDRECERMADYMVEEFKRYIKKEPLKYVITKEKAKTLA